MLIIRYATQKKIFCTTTCAFVHTKYSNYQGVSISTPLISKTNVSMVLLNIQLLFLDKKKEQQAIQKDIDTFVFEKKWY